MTLFRREKRADRPTDNLAELLRRRTPAVGGQYVDADSARRHSAVWACRDLIARIISTLPVHEYRKGADGARRELPDPPLLISPDGDLPPSAWFYAVIDSLLGSGNVYGLVLARDNRPGERFPTKIQILDPARVSVLRRGRQGPVEFRLEGERIDKYPFGDLWHVPAYVVAGSPIGLSPIAYAAKAIGLGLSAENFGSDFFAEGAHPTGVLTTDQQINRDSATLIKQRFMDAVGRTREPAVLGAGLQYTQVQIAPEESQFLDTIKANVATVARFYGVPPEEIGGESGNSMTYANQEQRSISLLNFTIGPWVTRIEEALTALRPRPRFVKFNLDAFLRSDTATRYRVHDMAIRSGMFSRDERRRLEEMQPIPDESGGRYLWPPGRMQLTEREMEQGADEGTDEDVSSNGSEPVSSNGSSGADVLELTQALQRIYLAVVNGVITAQEARVIVNRMGADLPVELPTPQEEPA